MIDKSGRKEPRFPPDIENSVTEKIREIVQNERGNVTEELLGIAGGACGGDIIFHEVCQEMGIKSDLYLALSKDEFLNESVSFAGPQWVERFNRLYEKLSLRFLPEKIELPEGVDEKKEYTIWERNNLWELNSALVNGGDHMILIALWDGKGGDGPGGTQHMVETAKEKGAKTIVIDIKQL